MAKELLKDLIYGEQIITDGCKVDFAVGLTYSLNLEAMLTVPLAFGELGELDSNVRQSPVFLLEGIRRASDKIALFCNKGSIHVPKESKSIFSLLEGSIFEVQNDLHIFSNFHPKLWLVKETDKEGTSWLKLAVMSRNLDFSSCLDICCTLRGKVGGRRRTQAMEKHKPLKDYLIWLSKYANTPNARRVIELANTLDYVEKFELDAPFQTEDAEKNEDEGYAFYPFAYREEEFKKYNEPLETILPGDRILVISPFIDVKTLQWLTSKKKCTNSILITRKEYVTQRVFKLFDEVWVPNDSMIDNTTAKVDLHAKMYLTHRLSGEDLGYTLYLGSANATDNAFHKNCEFLLRLHYKRTTNDRIKEMLEEMTSDHKFVKLDAPNPEASDNRESNNDEITLKKAMTCLKKATIKRSDTEGLYDILLSIKSGFDPMIKIRPLQCENYWKDIDGKVVFSGLKPHLLSEFYVLSIVQEGEDKPLQMVAKVATNGMPQNRDEAIYQSIVTKKEELLDYVAFMLSDSPTEFFFEQQLLKEKNKKQKTVQGQIMTMPLYEQLLKVASTNPEQINEVQRFIKKLKPEIVPDELNQILKMFQNVSKQIESL